MPDTEPTGDAPDQSGGGLLRSSLVVSSLTFLSRILGLVRDVVIAHFFGAGAGADVFFLANRIPNFFRRLFAEGAFNAAFVPVFAGVLARDGPRLARGFAERMLALMLVKPTTS